MSTVKTPKGRYGWVLGDSFGGVFRKVWNENCFSYTNPDYPELTFLIVRINHSIKSQWYEYVGYIYKGASDINYDNFRELESETVAMGSITKVADVWEALKLYLSNNVIEDTEE